MVILDCYWLYLVGNSILFPDSVIPGVCVQGSWRTWGQRGRIPVSWSSVAADMCAFVNVHESLLSLSWHLDVVNRAADGGQALWWKDWQIGHRKTPPVQRARYRCRKSTQNWAQIWLSCSQLPQQPMVAHEVEYIITRSRISIYSLEAFLYAFSASAGENKSFSDQRQ